MQYYVKIYQTLTICDSGETDSSKMFSGRFFFVRFRGGVFDYSYKKYNSPNTSQQSSLNACLGERKFSAHMQKAQFQACA
jgi:hypothetical protein